MRSVWSRSGGHQQSERTDWKSQRPCHFPALPTCDSRGLSARVGLRRQYDRATTAARQKTCAKVRETCAWTGVGILRPSLWRQVPQLRRKRRGNCRSPDLMICDSSYLQINRFAEKLSSKIGQQCSVFLQAILQIRWAHMHNKVRSCGSACMFSRRGLHSPPLLSQSQRPDTQSYCFSRSQTYHL